MNAKRIDNVTFLSEEKYTTLSEQNGWPIAFAEGYVSGQAERWRGNPLSSYTLTGIDQYALGFRAGYFARPNADRGAGRPRIKPITNTNAEKSAANVE